jgi:hypothetical protein
MDEIYSKTGHQSTNSNSNVNLLDFEFDKKPTKVNILNLSPLHEKKEDADLQIENLDLKKNGNDPEVSTSTPVKNHPKISSDINDLFENIKLFEPPKEVSKVEKIKEIYNSKFTENEASKIDKIYNLFGGPSFSIDYTCNNPTKTFSPIHVETKRNSFKNIPSDFSLKEEKRDSFDSNANTHKYVCNLYPSFENTPNKKTPFDEKPNPQNKDLFDLFN